MKVSFKAWEYISDDKFIQTEYDFVGDKNSGWEIFRNNKPHLKLGEGYELFKSKYCGICSTDLARRFLPFPLPQITGHEVVATSLDGKKNYVLEINDTYQARGVEEDIFCKSGIPTHSPDRMVLGIDRLPGGFGEYILSPINAAIEFDEISPKLAVLIEPFAACLQSVIASPPKKGDHVAVLGPRRLGNLLIAALASYKKSHQIDFEISALARHNELLEVSKKLGADSVFRSDKLKDKKFDIVYDTTSTESGFLQALEIAKRELHLKTTNGQEMSGLKKLTELVVDELSLMSYSEENLNFKWENANYKNEKIVVSENSKISLKENFYKSKISDAEKILESEEFQNRIPRFDLSIVSNLEEIDLSIRPSTAHENSLVRPRGAILFSGESNENPVLKFLNSGGKIRSSRCGDFHKALKLLSENKEISENLVSHLITHRYSSKNMNEAFLKAKEKDAVKVVIEHE